MPRGWIYNDAVRVADRCEAGKETGMRKALVLLLALTVMLAALAIVGCGTSDTETAKQYMQKGDQLSSKITIFTSETMLDAGGLLTKLGVQYADAGTVKAKTLTDEGKKQIKKLIAAGEAAKAEYGKILGLGDADLYKQYADARISAIDNTITVLNSLNSLLDELASAPAGTPVQSVVVEWGKSNTDAAVAAVKAYANAQDAKKLKAQIVLSEKKK
jgi:hypothetical protein